MNAVERIKMVKAMEFICRNINDESVFANWLVSGVADGDIMYSDLEVSSSDEEDLEYYLEDTHFADLMDTFLYCMKQAWRSGGLYCDNVASGSPDENN